jgi:calcineurin-like phosphoesterase family protein
MNVYLISDTHFNHQNIATYCDRPSNFTEIIIRNWNNTVQPEDFVIHLGDVQIGQKSHWIIPNLTGRKVLVRGNHDREKSNMWWMEHGFDFACDGMKFRNCWLSHEPAKELPEGCELNIHGHLHNIWHGFHPDRGATPTRLYNSWQRLFAVEYTDYYPVEFDKFIFHPKKYLATGLGT